MKKLLILFLPLFILSSCSTRKEIVYFQGAEDLQNYKSLLEFEPVFEVNDVIQINVSSIDENLAQPFLMNSGVQNMGGVASQGSAALMGYLVDINGKIQFPVLGQIEVAGKSRSELETFLTNELRGDYLKDAVVAVRLLNFRVVVLGEAGNQTVVEVENERMSIVELLANVGGISYDGKRENIMIIREVDGIKTIGYIDMTSADVFKNPFYYLKQNDIVYVEPTYRKVKSAGFITDYSAFIGLFSTALSLYFIITSTR